jgi:hypothetical protein
MTSSFPDPVMPEPDNPVGPRHDLDALTVTLRDGVNDYCRQVLILLGTHARTPQRDSGAGSAPRRLG